MQVHIKLIDSLAIDGQIGEITFLDSYIETIRPFAFNILKNNALRLIMDKVQIQRIEPQVIISKKAQLSSLKLFRVLSQH